MFGMQHISSVKANSSPLRINGWKMTFCFGAGPLFKVSGMVSIPSEFQKYRGIFIRKIVVPLA